MNIDPSDDQLQAIYEKDLAVALLKYPNACGKCLGSGLLHSHGTYDHPPETDPCYCLEEGRCPRCSKATKLREVEHCDWSYCECGYDEEKDNNPVLPDHWS